MSSKDRELRTWHVFRRTDGTFTGGAVSAATFDEIAGSESQEFGLKDGVTDWLSQRVAVESEAQSVVDYQPPAPGADHEWIQDDEEGNRVRRWMLKPDVAERRARELVAKAQIEELERKGLRALRELMLNPNNPAARKRVQDMNQQIERLAIDGGLSTPESREQGDG